jgi:hypothetical protein
MDIFKPRQVVTTDQIRYVANLIPVSLHVFGVKYRDRIVKLPC